MKKTFLIMISVALSMSLGTSYAAKPAKSGTKRIFCWEEQGKKVCGDALPSYVTTDQQRQEINSKTGTMRTVAPAPVKVAETPSTPVQPGSGTEVESTLPQMTTEEAVRVQALVQAYESEDDLLKSFEEEKRVSEQSLKDLFTQEKAAHGMLVQQLKILADKELSGKAIGKNEQEELLKLRQSLVQARAMKSKEQEKQKNMSQQQARLLELFKQVKSSL